MLDYRSRYAERPKYTFRSRMDYFVTFRNNSHCETLTRLLPIGNR